MSLPVFALAAAALQLSPVTAQAPSTVTVDWASPIRTLKTTPAHQVVVNPVTARESPYHDQVFDKIAALGAPYQRFVPWLPYPRMGIAELEPPSHSGLCGFVNSGGPDNIWSTTLDCGAQGAGVIDGVTFADYGKPTGFCDALTADAKCTKDVKATVAAACVGKPSCTLLSSDATFGAAPCGGNRLAVEVTCSNKAVTTFTYWDFKVPDEGMLDFLAAANSSERTAIPNFSTIPNWLLVNGDRSYFPDDPLGETWGYESGKVFRDASLKDLGDYYGRLLAHYVEGGFMDEGGRWIPGYNLTISTYEVLNEIEGEHGLSPELYTQVYDAIVSGIRKWAPRGSASMKFMGLALENSGNVQYMQYFLNASNHAPGIPIDFVSFHHYASAARDGGVNGSAYASFFTSGDAWLEQVKAIQAVRDALNPTVMLDADEVGVILSDDNDQRWTADEPGFPAIYWNAAAAMYAYLFGTTAALGLDILGESQMVGYPSIPFPRGEPYNGPWTAPPQFPSVSLLSWGGAFGAPGDGTARYWALKLLLDSFKPGPPAGTFSASEADVLVSTQVSGGGAAPSNPFCGTVLNLDTMSLACSDPGAVLAVQWADYGTPSGQCGSWVHNASCTSPNATAIVESYCQGKNSCQVPFTTDEMGDPCYGT